MKSEFLSELNEKQTKAVTQPRCPILMLAGPGTGKTRTLIARIIYEIENHQIPPERILALTFSNKAATEVRQRLLKEIPEKAEKIRSGTFHSVCLKILRKYPEAAGLNKHFSVCDDTYRFKLVTTLLTEKTLENSDQKARGILQAFSNSVLKNKPLPAFSAALYDEYLNHLNRHHLVDFDQILFKVLELFKKNKDILDQYRYMNESILVDEFQDTDPIQYEIVKLLAEKHRNLFIVADDDQSIYAWRGAHPENIRNYMRDFLIEKPIMLDVNYRSGQQIIDAAQAIVETVERIEPDKKISGDSEKKSKLQALFFKDESRETWFILKKIVDWQRNEKIGLEDIAIIYPRHVFAEKIIPFLLKEKIPFQQAGGKNLTEHPAMKTILLYLRLILNPGDPLILEDLLQIELGYHLFKQVQDIQRIKHLSFRQALNELAVRDEISYKVRNQISTFIGNVANLVNLKTFFTFDHLVDDIIKSMQNLKPGVLDHNALKLKDVDFKFREKLLSETVKIWLYHTNDKLFFIAASLLEKVFGKQVFRLEHDKIIHVAKTDFVVLLEPLESIDLLCPYETIFTKTDSHRQSTMSALFRWVQVQLRKKDKVFSNYTVFDLETTGKNVEKCGIMEIAAVKVSDGEIVEEFQTLVNPSIMVEPEAESVHHISDKDVAESPKIEEVWPDFIKFIGKDILIAHNGYGFDFKILDRVSKEIGQPRVQNLRYDSLILARNLFPNKQNSIDALVDRYKMDAGTRHRALDDVRVLHQIFQKLLAVKESREIRTTAADFTEYISLANVIENKLSAVEDKIFYMAGAPKLQSPYSEIRKSYALKFLVDEDELLANLIRIAGRIGPHANNYTTENDFFRRILVTADEFKKKDIDESIAEFLSFIALMNPQDTLEKIDAISLLTFHAAKGLEFEKVIIMGMEDDNMPSFFAKKTDAEDDRPVSKKIEEQKRLLYVGMTRSKSEVIFTAVKNRNGRWQKSSPFLDEIKDQLLIRESV